MANPDLSANASLQARYLDFLRRKNKGASAAQYLDLRPLYPATERLLDLLAQVDDLKRCLDSFRPFDADQIANLDRAFGYRYTYDSNRIEGNTLTLQETTLILEKGVTIAGKSLREHLEASNHAHAFDYVRELAQGRLELSPLVVRRIHQLILSGIDPRHAGIYRQVDVVIAGSAHQPPPHFLVPERMEAFFAWYEAQRAALHPVVLAAEAHDRLVSIHPFVDGNGRTSRLVMNLLLLAHGYPIAVISGETASRLEYYAALDASQVRGNPAPFHRLVAGAVKESAIWYLERISTTQDVRKGAYFYQRIAPLLAEGDDEDG